MGVSIEPIAPGVGCIRGTWQNGNVYIVDDVLLDGFARWGRRRLLEALGGSRIRRQVLTHVHPPTQGTSRDIVEHFGAQVACGKADLEALRSGRFDGTIPDKVSNRLIEALAAGPAVPEATALSEGDDVGGFEVLDTPGHSPGHISFWRAEDRVLIVGDVITNRSYVLGRRGLRPPPKSHTLDNELNRRSALRLADLEPRVVCFTHGPPLRDPAVFEKYVADLADASP